MKTLLRSLLNSFLYKKNIATVRSRFDIRPKSYFEQRVKISAGLWFLPKQNYATQPLNTIITRYRQTLTDALSSNKFNFIPNVKARLRVTAFMLYESVTNDVDYLRFVQEFHMPDTFHSWFLITELHVWMLLVRAMAEGCEEDQNGFFLRNCVVLAMWHDVEQRTKHFKMDKSSKEFKPLNENLSNQFQAALIAYDEGIWSDRKLATALWLRLMNMHCDNYESIEKLVKYVRKNMAMLDCMRPEEYCFQPIIGWIDLESEEIEK